MLRSLTGLQSASPLELAKFLAANVGGKVSAIVVAIMGTLYLFSAELPDHWAAFCGRAQWTCISYLLAIMFWRQIRNAQLLTRAIAAATIADPNQNDSSSDPAVQREIGKQKASASQTGAPVR